MPSTTELPARALRATPSARLAGWLVGPCTLLGTTAAVLLVTRGVDRAFGITAASFAALALAWVLVSTFWPAAPDRTCPECGRPGLARLDARTTRGVLCAECGASDPDRSSFLMAEEEEGPLEPMIAYEKAHGSKTSR